jgi:hypothetical protein
MEIIIFIVFKKCNNFTTEKLLINKNKTMKNFKVFTIAALMAGAAFSFTSCGGGDATGTDEKEEKVKLEDGLGYVKQLIKAVESGDIKVDKSTKKDITKYFDFEDSGDEYLSDDNDFEGYRLDKSYTMADGVLNSISYNTFYDKEEEDLAKKDSKTVLEFLEKTLGESEGSGDTYFTWTKSKYEISFNIFSDGYSLYVKSFTEIEYDDYEGDEAIDGDCAPDFYALRDDLVDKLVANIANGKIKLNKTTKEEIATLTGDANDFNHDYKGMNVSGYYSYTDGVLTSFSLNYFYTCDAATDLLSLDKSELGTDISAALNVDGKKDGTGDDAGTTWKIDGQTLKQSNFSDGYAYYFN